MEFSNKYILGFAFAICLVCSLVVSTLAVVLQEAQERNRILDRQTNVLRVVGIISEDESPSRETVDRHFEQIRAVVIDRASGEVDESIDPLTYDPVKAAKDPATSQEAGGELAKKARVKRLPDKLLLYRVEIPGKESVVFPIYGYGLWSTLYGYLALDENFTDIRGITYYQHGETPGLGGEVDNPAWKRTWTGKRAYNPAGEPAIEVVKQGTVPNLDEYQVDGLSGATITSRGVTNMLKLWLSDDGYGKYLKAGARS